MTYATVADLTQAFTEREIAQLTNRAVTYAETVDDAVANAALGDATAIIDSALAVRYAVPVASPPQALRAACLDIARFRLYDDAAPAIVRQRYEDAMRWLAALAAGKAVLLTSGGVAAPAAEESDQGPAVGVAGTTLVPAYGTAFVDAYGRGDLRSGITPL